MAKRASQERYAKLAETQISIQYDYHEQEFGGRTRVQCILQRARTRPCFWVDCSCSAKKDTQPGFILMSHLLSKPRT